MIAEADEFPLRADLVALSELNLAARVRGRPKWRVVEADLESFLAKQALEAATQ